MIPVLGYLDDLIIMPMGIAILLRMVFADCPARAEFRTSRPVGRVGAATVMCVWLVAAAWVILAIRGLLTS